MKIVGKVLDLFLSHVGKSGKVKKEALTLDEKGILHDKYYDTNLQRSVLLTSQDSYHLAESQNITMPHGSLGENILMDFNPYYLSTGVQLQIGEVILEISQNCTICDHLSNIHESLPTLLKEARGIFSKVVQGGVIKKGDEIILL